MLFSYMQQVERLLRDQRQRLINPDDIRDYCNRARREIAMRTQSIRRTPPSSGAIVAIHVTNGGSGYTDPAVLITSPDYPLHTPILPNGDQATATAMVVGGQIVSVSVNYGGQGYMQPFVQIVDPTGSGAKVAPELSPIWTTNAFQEEYDFTDINLGMYPGVKSVFAVRSVAQIYANYRYYLPRYPWTTYQSFIRQYPNQYIYVPTMMSQYKYGSDGSLFFYPIPSTTYAWDWDCYCIPVDLEDDQSVEALPEPWTDAVPYLGMSFCMEELQNLNAARYWQDKYDNYVKRYSSYVQPGWVTNPYGGW